MLFRIGCKRRQRLNLYFKGMGMMQTTAMMESEVNKPEMMAEICQLQEAKISYSK